METIKSKIVHQTTKSDMFMVMVNSKLEFKIHSEAQERACVMEPNLLQEVTQDNTIKIMREVYGGVADALTNRVRELVELLHREAIPTHSPVSKGIDEVCTKLEAMRRDLICG